MPNKIFTQDLEGTRRRRGRPRKGWKEEVERDLQDGESWWQIGKKWKDFVRQAKAHSRL